MKTINELQDEIIEEFSDFDDWMDKYQLLIDIGSEQPALPDEYKTEQNLIDGCQSRVWLQADLKDGTITLPATVIHLMLDLGIFNYPSHYHLFSTVFRFEKIYHRYWNPHQD